MPPFPSTQVHTFPIKLTPTQWADKRLEIAALLLTKTLTSSSTPVDTALNLADDLLAKHQLRSIPKN